MAYLLFVSRCVLGLVFAVSAGSKLRSPTAFRAFRDGLAAMKVVPTRIRRPVAVAAAGLEVAVPVLLLVPATVLVGLGVAVLLLAAFSAAIAVTLARGTTASCPCFGVSSTPFGRRHLVRNGLLLAVACGGCTAALTTASLPSPAAAALAAGGSLVVALLVISSDELFDLFVGPVRP